VSTSDATYVGGKKKKNKEKTIKNVILLTCAVKKYKANVPILNIKIFQQHFKSDSVRVSEIQ